MDFSRRGGAISFTGAGTSNPAIVVVAWILVGVPILIGVWITLGKAWILFK